MNSISTDPFQLITGIILVGVGVVVYSRKEMTGEMWNIIAVLVTGTGGYMLISLIPTNQWINKNLLYITLGIVLCIMIIKSDGQISTLIGLLAALALCYVFWNTAPQNWRDWVGYVWGKFLEFGAKMLSFFGIHL